VGVPGQRGGRRCGDSRPGSAPQHGHGGQGGADVPPRGRASQDGIQRRLQDRES
jgi:hypothetical protein